MYYGNRSRDGLGQFYSAMQFRQQEQKRKEAEEELRRQQEKQRRQQREANKHSAFGDTLKLIGTVGGAAVGSFTPVGPVGGAAIGSTLADATMAFAPNVGGTQPGADNPYYTPTSDTQKALLAANAGIQFMGQYRDRELKLAARNAADLRRKALEEQGFQATREYVSGGFGEKVTGSRPFESTSMSSLAQDLKDTGDYTFLTDDDLLLVAAGEAEKIDMFGPTLETMTLQASNLLLQELGKEGASTESVLAELDEGTTPWARQFKKAPRAAQVAAKSDFMKQSRATLASANAALREKAENLAEFHQGLADTGNSEAIKSRNALQSLINSANYPGEGSLPMGFTEEQISSGQIMSDPVLYRKLLSYSGTTNADIQFKAMEGTFGAISTFQNAFSKSELNRIAPSYEYVGGEGGEGAAPAKDAANRGSVPMQSPRVNAQNVTQEVGEINNQTAEDSAKGPVETTQRQVEPPAELADGVGVGLRQLLNLTDDEGEEETTPYDQTRSNFEARQQEKFAKAEDDPERLRAAGRPVNRSSEEARAIFEAEKEQRKTRSRRPGLAAEYQRDLALGEVANEDPPPPLPPESERQVDTEQIDREKQSLMSAAPQGDRNAVLQSYGLSTEQPAGAAVDPAVAPIQTSDMSSLNALKDQVTAAPETRAAVPKEQAPGGTPLDQVKEIRESIEDKLGELRDKLDQVNEKVRKQSVSGEQEMNRSLSVRQAIFQTEDELKRIITKYRSIDGQVEGQDSPTTRSPNVDQAYQDARDQYAELDQKLAVLNTRLDKVLGGEQTSGRMMPRRGEEADTEEPEQVQTLLQKGIEEKDIAEHQDLIEAVINIESNGNPNAKNNRSRAFGLFQLTKAAFKDYGKGERGILKNEIDAGLAYIKDKISELEKARIPLTPENYYVLHFFGSGGKWLLKSDPETKLIDIKYPSGNQEKNLVGEKELTANPRDLNKDMTVQEFMDQVKAKFNKERTFKIQSVTGAA